MKEKLILFIGALLVLTFFGLMTSSNALTEKEQLEKESGDVSQLQPIDIPIIMEHGGPDPGGYYYIDSYDSALNAPVFEWIDISGTGIDMGISNDDQNVGPFPIGFTFNFYGVDFTTFNACSNGWASFTSTNTTYSNYPIPSSSEPNNLLAVFWDDLHPHSVGHAYYYTNNVDTLIISWHNFERFSGTGSYTFQIILTADNHIVYQYQTMTGLLDSYTTGIENSSGTIGTQYRYNQSGVVDGLAVYFGLEPPIFGDPGALMGTVTDLQMNPIDGAIVTVSVFADTTGPDGSYYLELQPLTYSATASAQYHNPVTIDDIVIAENETTVVDFELPTPLINVNTEAIQLEVDSGEVVTVTRNISNVGDGVLDFDIEVVIGDLILDVNPNRGERVANIVDPAGAADVAPYSYTGGDPPIIADFQDSVFALDLGFLGDTQLLGIEFDGIYFWITGGNSGADPNKLYKLDSGGGYVAEYDQTGTTSWGWRDLAFDGEFLYGSDDGIIDQIDPATGNITGVTISGPENPNRAMAYNPDNDHFYTANFSSSIYEFDRSGSVVNIWSNSNAIYGMAYDNISSDGPWLWVFSQDGSPQQKISQFDPATGTYTGITWQCALPTGFTDGVAGGACLTTDWDPSIAALFLLGQGTPNDFIYGYEIAPFSRWLVVDPMSGMLQPAENIDIDITVDFTVENLNYDSTYMANLIIHNNTPLIPEIPVVVNGIVGIEDEVSGVPREFSVAQNYPNPFNARTNISFALPEQSDVRIEVFNLLGQKTATVAEGLMPAGHHTVTWDASDVASGIYYYKVTAGCFTSIKMMTLLK